MNTPLATRIAEEHAAAAAALPESVISPEQRRRAVETLMRVGMPVTRNENWKYTNLRPLERARFAPPTGAAPRLMPDALPPALPGYARYTFVDGIFAPALSAPSDQPGVTVRPLRSAGEVIELRAGADKRSATPDSAFALLNEAFVLDGAVIHVAAHTDCPGCLEVVFVASAEAKAGASYPRLELKVEAGARVGLVERHVSAGSDSSFINCAVRIDVQRGASVTHTRVQQVGAKALWFDTLEASLAQDAVYRLHVASLGGASARSTIHVQLAGERADVALHAVSVADRVQVHDTYAVVEHACRNTRTEQSFRGIAAGRSRVAFNGKVVVRPGANGADSQQSLRGLLAGAEAEIDVRPQLEIYTDDVKCSHGATAGKLDDVMLFYLLSRGLDPDTAQRLLKWAFLEDVVSRIEVPELRRQIEQSLAGQMNETTVLKELL